MKYILIVLVVVASACSNEKTPAEKKIEIVSKIQLYEDSVSQAKEQQSALLGRRGPRETVTLENVERINKRERDLFTKHQKEIGELDSKIMIYRVRISALESELRKY